MEQTAVEWLAEEIYKWENGLSIMTAIEIVKQAKEMEKQQQIYSEEDMTEYAMFVLLNKLITPKEWFEQFKK